MLRLFGPVVKWHYAPFAWVRRRSDSAQVHRLYKIVMSKKLSKKEAIEYLGLDEKTFDNYFKNAAEFPSLKRKGKTGRFYFDEDILRKWQEGLN